ncbi:glycoside hydrolase family 3 protein [Streptomyces bluensis]|uniref:glycoside hydrolase family 3 protein n=1 Tax=Streptomyces bluensis TaxID=33897 RepID=UPI0016742BF5|nr:glycoside hydrolase family 3 C-terminal domain-containing protein [Streptomyces bluensis]GGZ43012.1 glycosyl hydrolase [Streptomyces bluensis]
MPANPAAPDTRELLGRLTLAEKVKLLTGRDFWSTWPLEKIGLRSILMSDGPSGVRGPVWDERAPSLNLPSATSLSASWDDTVAYRYGAVIAHEARAKGVDVVLGPTINLHRSPLGGRHFEAFSEDPLLTGRLAAAYVRGIQDNGVAATPKHYIANDYETDRFTASTEVSERTLREVYLLPFEKAVTEARAWAVMSAYNAVNGVTATENDLLETPLNSEWGFDGVVISDWTAVRSTNAARAAQDLEMPGPRGAWGDALLAAVESGAVEEADIDRKVLRILTLAARVGALEGTSAVEPAATPDCGSGAGFAREAAAEGMVLVRNTGVLPLDPGAVTRIAVIGHNADLARTQGGGSATVVPEKVVSPLDGIIAAFPEADVEYALGAVVQEGIAELPLDALTNPATGEPGVHVRFLEEKRELFTEDRRATRLVWFGGSAPVDRSDTLEITTRYTSPRSETLRLGVAAPGVSRIWADGELVLDADVPLADEQLGAAFLHPPTTSAALPVTAGQVVEIRVEYEIPKDTGLAGALAYTLGTEADDSDPDGLIERAAAAAARADVAVVVVGTNSGVESEGFDRTSLALPGRQDALVSAVARANPRTVVAVNSGSPVELPWRDDTAAVLLTWFGGQEYGNALADVLTGTREPGGRLPTTWPARQSDVPVLDVTPVNGTVRYDEGVHVGYRAWLRSGATPAYPFGYGLGYTTWAVNRATATTEFGPDSAVEVRAEVTNTGDRAGKHVVQVYASRAHTAVDRPARWLVGHEVVRLAPGATEPVKITVPARAFAHWAEGAWAYEPGEFTLHVGSSADDLPTSMPVRLR